MTMVAHVHGWFLDYYHPGSSTIHVAHIKYLHQYIKMIYYDYGSTCPWLGKLKWNQTLVTKNMVLVVSGLLSSRFLYNSCSSYKI